MVPVGAMDLCWPGGGLFWPVGGGGFAFRGLCCWRASVGLGLWLRFGASSVSAIGGRFCHSRELGERVPRLSRFIVLVSFSDTLLVVSILDMKGLSLNSDLKF